MYIYIYIHTKMYITHTHKSHIHHPQIMLNVFLRKAASSEDVVTVGSVVELKIRNQPQDVFVFVHVHGSGLEEGFGVARGIQ